jgi:MFS family permease
VRRLLALAGAIVFVDTMFYGAIAPLLPYYEDHLSLSKASAGVLAGAYPAGTVLFALPGGWLAAAFGPRRTAVGGLLVMATATLAFGLAGNIILLDGARFVQGVAGTCMWAGALGWILGEGPRDKRGEMIGTALAAAVGGMVVGPVIGGAAAAAGPELVFSAVAGVAVVLAVVAARTPVGAPPGAPPIRAVGRALRTRSVVAAMWMLVLPSVLAGAVEVLTPLRLSALGASTTAIGVVFLVASAVEMLFSRAVGRFADRRGRIAPIRIALFVALVTLLLLPIPTAPAVLAVCIVAFWTGLAFFWAPSSALVADEAEAAGLPPEFVPGFSNLAWGSGQVIGSAAGGAIAAATADAVVYGLLAAACAGTLLLSAARRPRRPPAAAQRH